MTSKHAAQFVHGFAAVWARAGRLWRQFATGLCFVVYGTAGWVGGMTVLPLVMLWPGSAAARERRTRALASFSFRWLLGLITFLRVGRVHIEGRQWLAQAEGKLLVANHPMYLDVVALVGLLPQADCVIKGAMRSNRFYRRFVETIGYISNDGGSRMVMDAAAVLKRGRTLILFPEGTRSTPDQPLNFCRGAAQVAVRSGCQILPVVIDCQPLALGKGQAWHEVGDRPWQLTLRICRPRTLEEFDGDPELPKAVAARRVTAAMQAFFQRELAAAQKTRDEVGSA